MDSITAFALGQASKNKPVMVFDWIKAAQIIKDEQPDVVEAGLIGDWEWTGGVIYANGEIVEDSYTYLASRWAIPTILLDGISYRDCFRMQADTNWDSKTKWPEEAKVVLLAPD